MHGPDSERNPLEQLAEEFVERHRRGEVPALSEYTGRYPDWADDIRELFPALVAMDRPKPAAGDATGAGGEMGAGDRAPERLGDYRIVREVGRGGMGVVYEAEQVSLGRRVALKVLPPGLLDGGRLQRFQREAKAAAGLHHTNIVPVYGIGEHEGTHYFVMQFIQGQPLDQVLDELRHLRPVATTKTEVAVVARSLVTGCFSGPGEEDAETRRRGDTEKKPISASPRLRVSASSSETGRPCWSSLDQTGLRAEAALTYAEERKI